MGNRELEPRLAGTAFPRVVLFDLDGTLLDSAPDMLAAINVLRGERGHAPATLEQLRPHVSQGARAMILSAFPQLGEAAREALVQPRSAEHTSELQSLMRISYAVICLTKHKNT